MYQALNPSRGFLRPGSRAAWKPASVKTPYHFEDTVDDCRSISDALYVHSCRLQYGTDDVVYDDFREHGHFTAAFVSPWLWTHEISLTALHAMMQLSKLRAGRVEPSSFPPTARLIAAGL
ncbi:hypothetical protein C6P46_004962 [Rhodotorula mucilaginosa]|uniref:Uncharacterized protein n=1 Tax=Rhodotorula mucilaginosa TaxID=5537 RepID=A0A9P6W941_RHOMI|nr:hypothetical protein C6P46_004962 [Rhodotorula mucilaginosa]